MEKSLGSYQIVSFFELSEEWQKEARDNLDDMAEGASYLEPLESESPDKHVLIDLSNFMRSKHSEFDGISTISNTSVYAIKFSESGDSVELFLLT